MIKKIVDIEDFELYQYYWCSFNCGWLIGRVIITDPLKVSGKKSWRIRATPLNDNSDYVFDLETAIKVFVGGIVKAELPSFMKD
jgi:hypothetical protein